jgi:hypothetical protein
MPTPIEHLNEMLADLPASRGPRMPLSTLCAAFYLIHREFPRPLIAKTFGISEATVALLANCTHSDARRYQRVAAEWRKLGADRFGDLYYTQDIDDRVARIRAGVEEKRRRGADVRADKWAGDYIITLPDGSQAPTTLQWRMPGRDLSPVDDMPLPARWAFRETGMPDDHPASKWSWEFYPTSSEAHAGMYVNFGMERDLATLPRNNPQWDPNRS